MIYAAVLVLAVAAFLLFGEAAQARGLGGGGSFGGARGGGGMATGGHSFGGGHSASSLGGSAIGSMGGRTVISPSLGSTGLRGYGPPSMSFGRTFGGTASWPPAGGNSLYTPRQDTVYQTAPPATGRSSMSIRVLPPWQGGTTATQPPSRPIPLVPPGTISLQPSRGPGSMGPPNNGQPTFLRPPVGRMAVTPFKDFVRQRAAAAPLPGRLTPNLPGRLSPNVAGSTTVIDRFRSRDLQRPFGHMVDRFGQPGNRFSFTPRNRPDEFNGHHENGDGDDHHGHHHHHGIVDNDFFFPWYFSDPFWFGLWYPGYYPAPYSYYGWTPGWIEPSQAYYSQPTYPAYDYSDATAPAYDYALDVPGLSAAIGDLQQAWVTGTLDPVAAHLSDQVDVQVYFDGTYAYTTKAQDFSALTLDTMSTTRTVSVDFDDPIWISPTEVYFTGRQVFTDPDQVQHTMYLSYWLQQYANGWFITGFGSSQQPIASNYRDFRY